VDGIFSQCLLSTAIEEVIYLVMVEKLSNENVLWNLTLEN
jgi:hypothetical protein